MFGPVRKFGNYLFSNYKNVWLIILWHLFIVILEYCFLINWLVLEYSFQCESEVLLFSCVTNRVLLFSNIWYPKKQFVIFFVPCDLLIFTRHLYALLETVLLTRGLLFLEMMSS